MSGYAEDLALAQAAARQDAAALRRFETLLVRECDAAARRLDPSPAFASEVRQAVRVRLLVVDGGPARIHEYAGRGPLGGWLGVVALRVALNLKRSTRRTDHEILDELMGGTDDPALQHLKTMYRAEFREALEAALAALPDRQRALLRLVYVDGLRLVELGRLYQVHETTAARWVQRAAAEVADAVRQRLTTKLAVSPASLDSIARLVLSTLDASIARVLSG